MTETAKLTKWPRPERIRQRMHITLDPDVHDYLTKNIQNISQFIEGAIISIISEMDLQKPIYELKKTKEAILDGPVVIRTRDLRRVKATS